MATQTDIPDLSDDDKRIVFHVLDVALNRTILFAFLQGIYTGMVAFTLSKIFSRKRSVSTHAMAFVITILCILTAVSFVFYWTFTVYSFIHQGQNFWTVFMSFASPTDMAVYIANCTGSVACITTFTADSSLIWRCWIVWGRRWIIILLPLVFLILGIAFKILQIRTTVIQRTVPAINYATCTTIYISFILATTLLCTLLIIYRILSIEWAKSNLAGTRTYSLGAYRNIIEIIVESAALYSAALIVYIVITFQDITVSKYVEAIGEFIRGAAPTLLVGRVASGHSRPDDSWGGSAISSLHFGTGGHTQTSTKTSAEESAEEDLTYNDDFRHDVEAQAAAGQSDEEKDNVGQLVETEHVTDKVVCAHT